MLSPADVALIVTTSFAAGGYLGWMVGTATMLAKSTYGEKFRATVLEAAEGVLFRNKCTGMPVHQTRMNWVMTNAEGQDLPVRLIIEEDTDDVAE